MDPPGRPNFPLPGTPLQGGEPPALPKPVQSPHPPVIIGGTGKKRTPTLAARFADEFNTPFAALTEVAALYDGVRQACADAGRTELPVFSSALILCCGRDEAEVRRRAAVIGKDVDDLRAAGAAVGTPSEVVALIGQYQELGASRLYLQTLDLSDLDHLDLIAAQVAPQLS